MSDQFWLTRAQLKRIERHFPLSHGVPRVDDLRVISGIIHVIRNGLRWRDAPKDYGPHKTLYKDRNIPGDTRCGIPAQVPKVRPWWWPEGIQRFRKRFYGAG